MPKERERQTQIKIKYWIKSLENLINKLDLEIVELYDRKARGEKVDLLTVNKKEEQKKKYNDTKKELKEEIKQKQNLIINTPELLTVICVIPQETITTTESEEKGKNKIRYIEAKAKAREGEIALTPNE